MKPLLDEILIMGGGAIGASIAWALTREPFEDRTRWVQEELRI